MGMRTAILALGFALGLGSAWASDVHVTIDQADLVRLPHDAAAVVVGNPGIADATLFDARTVFLTGKVFGRTNLIAVNASGRVIYTADITVGQPDENLVQVYYGMTKPRTFVCDPVCQAVPQIGDDHPNFEELNSQRTMTRSSATEN